MTRTLSYFLAGVLAGWLLLAGGGYALSQDYGLICAGVAGLICIIPTMMSLSMTLWSNGKSGSEQLMAVVAGMGVRMMTVLGVSLAVFLTVPFFREEKSQELTYWAFVLIGYLGTLALETIVSVRHAKQPAPPAERIGG